MTMRSVKLFLLMMAVLRVSAQEIPVLENYTLKNGLKVSLMKYGKIEAINISVVINSGKKNETPGQQGYNHLVANLLLKGNKKYKRDDFDDKAFAIGASFEVNAGLDNTSISANVLSKDAAAAFDLFSSAMLQPEFSKEKVDQEVNYLIDYNNPMKMDISAMARVYSDLSLFGTQHPLGRSIYKQQLQQISGEKLAAYHAFNYTPKNVRIIVCGNFNTATVKQIIESNFGSWQSQYGEINGVSLDGPAVKKKEVCFVNRSAATQSALQWNKLAPGIRDKDHLAFQIANALFNRMLFDEIREKGGKTYSIHSTLQNSQFANLFHVSCSVRNSELLNTMELFDKTLLKFSQADFTKEEYDNQVNLYKVNVMKMEKPEEVARFYNPVLYNFESRKNILEDIDALKMEDVQKAIKKYFTPGVYKLVISGDEHLVKDQLSKLTGLKKYSASDLEFREPVSEK